MNNRTLIQGRTMVWPILGPCEIARDIRLVTNDIWESLSERGIRTVIQFYQYLPRMFSHWSTMLAFRIGFSWVSSFIDDMQLTIWLQVDLAGFSGRGISLQVHCIRKKTTWYSRSSFYATHLLVLKRSLSSNDALTCREIGSILCCVLLLL